MSTRFGSFILGFAYLLGDTVDHFARGIAKLCGYGFHVQRDTSGAGFFSFAHRQHSPNDREAWGLGLHVAVSKL